MTPPKNSELEETLAPVADIFIHMEKALRSYRIYAEDHVTVKQFEEKLHDKILAFLKSSSELTIGVKPYEFLFTDHPVYSNTNKEENFSYQFHQDGVRQITFIEGVTLDELHRFLGIARTDFESYENSDDDVVTLLWKAEFDHISYVVVETFLNQDDETVDVESILAKMMKTHLEDRSFPTTASLLSGRLPAVRRRLRRKDAEEIMNLPDISEAAAAPEGQGSADQIRTQLDTDDEVIIRRMILVLFRVLLDVVKKTEFEPIARTIRRLMDSLIRVGQYGLCAKLLWKLKELSDPVKNPSAKNAELIKAFYEEACDPSYVEQIERAVLSPKFDNIKEFSQFLEQLHPRCALQIVHLFRNVDRSDVRSALVPILAAIGSKDPDLLAPLDSADQPELAMASLDIFAQIGGEKAAIHIKRAYRNPDVRIRAKAIDLLASQPAIQATNLWLSALEDKEKVIRMKALNALVHSGNKKVAKPIFDVTESKAFESRHRDEKRQYFVALARIGGNAILPILQDQLNASVLDRGENATERRVAVISALHDLGTPEARTLIEDEHKRKFLPREIREACEEALQNWQPKKGQRN